MVQYGRPSRSSWAESVRSSFGRTAKEKQVGKILCQYGWEKVSNWECLFVHREKGLFLSVYVDDRKLAGKKQNINPMWKVLNKEVDLGEPTSFLDHVYLGCTQRQCEISKDIVDNYRAMFESRISAGATEKLPCSENLRISSSSCDMERHGQKCVERHCELANKTTQQLYKVSTPCIDDHHFKDEDLKSVGVLSKVSSQIVLKYLYLAHWKTWYSLVGEQICTIDYKVDQSLWPTPESMDILHSSYLWIQTTLSCGKHCKTMLAGTVSRLRFCRRSWGFKIYIRRSFVHFWKSNICTDQLDVQEANVSCLTAPQNQRSYRWMLVCVWTVYLCLTYGIWSLKCWERLKEYQNQSKYAHGKLVLRPKSHPRLNQCWIRMWICRT